MSKVSHRQTHPTFEKIVPSRPWIADMYKFMVTSNKCILISQILVHLEGQLVIKLKYLD